MADQQDLSETHLVGSHAADLQSLRVTQEKLEKAEERVRELTSQMEAIEFELSELVGKCERWRRLAEKVLDGGGGADSTETVLAGSGDGTARIITSG